MEKLLNSNIKTHTLGNLLLYKYIFILLFSLFILPFEMRSQTQNQNNKKVTATFSSQVIELKTKSELISNVLKVKNINGTPKDFYIDVNCPNDWKVLNSTKQIYTVNAGDSIYIPVRVIPSLLTFKGGSLYMINVFLIATIDGKQLDNTMFKISKPSKRSWALDVLPESRIYFLNDHKKAPFSVSVANNGEDKEDISLFINHVGQSLNIADTAGQEVKKRFFDITLNPSNDTTLKFLADIKDVPRNFKRVDLDNHNPKEAFETRKYTIFFRATEPKTRKIKKSDTKKSVAVATKVVSVTKKINKTHAVRYSKTLDFIRLSDNVIVNNYRSSIIPVSVEANFHNIFGFQPIGNTIIRSNKLLSPTSSFNFLLQNNFSYYSPEKFLARGNSSFYLGYYSKHWDFSVGTNAGLMGIGGSTAMNSGNGSAASYHTKRFRASAFYSRGPILGSPINHSYGAGVSGNFFNRLTLSAGSSQSRSLILPSDARFVFARANYRANKFLSLFVGYNYRVSRANINAPGQITTEGNFFNGGYSALFLKQRLNQSMSANFGDTYYANVRLRSKFSIVLSNKFSPKSRAYLLRMRNSYFQSQDSLKGFSKYDRLAFSNSFSYSKSSQKKGSLVPNFFYNYSQQALAKMHFRGIGFNSFYGNQEKNTRASVSSIVGYNRYIDSAITKELFSLQFYGMVQWQTFTMNANYYYGPAGIYGAKRVLYSTNSYPQIFRTSLSYEYLFKNRRFVLRLPLSYAYNNTAFSHNININPQVYLFTYNDWRLRLDLNYSYLRNNLQKQFQYTSQSTFEDDLDKPTVGNVFTIGVGIKKDFGIPIPKKWSKIAYGSPTFLAFLDFNGNRVMDKEEALLENIVIRVDNYEILTNEKGSAFLTNMPAGRYSYNVFSLVDLGGWFYQHLDSLDIDGRKIYYIPYTRGVKVFGNVVIDREKYSSDVVKDLDISRIKLSVIDTAGKTQTTLTNTKGEFYFYVQYGTYVLSMDQNVLGEKFTLAQNNIKLELEEGMDSYFNSFYVIEKHRKVKKKIFGADGKYELVEVDPENNKAYPANNNRNPNNKILNFDQKQKQLDSLITQLNMLNNKSPNRADLRLIVIIKTQKLATELSYVFYIKLAEVPKGVAPEAALSDLLKKNNLKGSLNMDGSITYTAGDFKTIAEAEKECLKYMKAGLTKATIEKK